jgi:hypothetical protein
MDARVQLPKGYAYVHYKVRKDAQEAIAYMDGVSVISGAVCLLLLHDVLTPPPPPCSFLRGSWMEIR